MTTKDFFTAQFTPLFLAFITLVGVWIHYVSSFTADNWGILLYVLTPLPVIVLITDLLMKYFIKNKKLNFTIQAVIVLLLIIGYIIFRINN